VNGRTYCTNCNQPVRGCTCEEGMTRVPDPPRPNRSRRAYNRYMVQIVWGKGGRMKQESLPHVFPATKDGYQAMRDSLVECVDRLDKIIAAETDDARSRA
jgi:hypothetical protein